MNNKNLNWNLKRILGDKTINELKKEISLASKEILRLQKKISANESNLQKFITNSEIISINSSKIRCFLYNQLSEDVANTNYQKQLQDMDLFLEKIDISLSFTTNEIKDNIVRIIDLAQANPYLKNYLFNFEKIKRSKKHQISDDAEKIIANFQNALSCSEDTFSKLTNADFAFEDVSDGKHKYKMNQGNASFYLRNPNKTIRESAYFSFWKTYYDHKNTLSSTYYHNLLLTSSISKIYKHKDSLSACLFSDNINRKFYSFILQNVKDNAYLIKDWKKILAKVTKINNPKPWDWNGPLFDDSHTTYNPKQAITIIKESLKILGEDYSKKVNYIFDNNLINWMPKDKKRSGAYSYGVWDADPYILLNWNGKFVDLSTLVHELGHSIHSLYSNEHQPYATHDYPIFLAEVASITNEILLVKYLLSKKDISNDVKKSLLENLIKEFIATVWRQSQFAEFEMIVHDKVDSSESLNWEDFYKIAKDLNHAYFPKTPQEQYKDEYEGIWSLYIPHFYSDFYVYKYVTGAIAAFAFAEKILNDPKYNRERYINFLKSGSSQWPLVTLKQAGVDLLSQDTYTNSFKLFSDLLKQLEKIV